jgi:hypothetical protein
VEKITIEIPIERTKNPRIVIVGGELCASPAEARAAIIRIARARALELYPLRAVPTLDADTEVRR